MNIPGKTLSSLSSDSLFSTIVTFYTLLLLYFPPLFLRFIFSPVIFSTLILLLYLLRLGAAQKSTIERSESDSTESLPQQTQEFLDVDHKCEPCISSTDTEPGQNSGSVPETKHDSHPFYTDSFVEWDVRAPLEVIYEEYEGEDGEENDSEAKRELQMNIIQRYASLSLFYPESDSDASSEGDFPTKGEWDSPENMCFRWEEEDDRDGLIEIALDEKRSSEVDEENLIEIDLSPVR